MINEIGKKLKLKFYENLKKFDKNGVIKLENKSEKN